MNEIAASRRQKQRAPPWGCFSRQTANMLEYAKLAVIAGGAFPSGPKMCRQDGACTPAHSGLAHHVLTPDTRAIQCTH